MSMQIITRARQGGKTTDLIELASKNHYYIVCPTQRDVDHIMRLARKLHRDIPMPITWAAFEEKRYYGQNIKGFVIDNLDRCLSHMTQVPVKAVSLTVEDEA